MCPVRALSFLQPAVPGSGSISGISQPLTLAPCSPSSALGQSVFAYTHQNKSWIICTILHLWYVNPLLLTFPISFSVILLSKQTILLLSPHPPTPPFLSCWSMCRAYTICVHTEHITILHTIHHTPLHHSWVLGMCVGCV